MTMKTLIKIAAVTLALFASPPAFAGKGGSAAAIQSAVRSNSVDAILAEVERAEKLMCSQCIDVMTNLTEHPRYEVRNVAAWWFAKRPALAKVMAEQFGQELASGETLAVRNAADFLGGSGTLSALPGLRAAIKRDVGAEAKLAIVRAVRSLSHNGGNAVLTHAMGDASPAVRAAAAAAWREILGQTDASPVAPLLGDADATVRAEAATVVGGFRFAGAATTLEGLVANDASATVRRNAAWALGRIGSSSSRAALTLASGDKSSLVRMTARAALSRLR
jgi:HEAT repeat protein